MYEYRTASFIVGAKKGGERLEEVDKAIDSFLSAGWEFVQLSSNTSLGVIAMGGPPMSVVLVVRREKQS